MVFERLEQLEQLDGAKVLVIGNGAREHAIVWALARSPRRPELFVAPGNPGMKPLCHMVDIQADDIDGLVRFVQEQGIQLVVPGPEAPLAAGISDRLLEIGVPVFGPVRAAAQLESSKAFAKQVMTNANVPTAQFQAFTDRDAAKAYVLERGAPIVVKADGLASGKGVVVAQTVAEALSAIDDMMVGKRFGLSGERVVIEDYLTGTEVSLMFFVSGDTVLPMLPARDHKPVFDDNKGPNTGGMGAFAPVDAFVEAGLIPVVEVTIVRPVLDALTKQGTSFCGVLYAGLMVTPEGPKVIEFNCRFGDPETESVLPLLDTDLLDVMWKAATGTLAGTTLEWKRGAAVSVICAASGYPERPRLGDEIEVPEVPADGSTGMAVFHAGTTLVNGQLVTSGGRVVAVTGWADTFEEARAVAYSLADRVHFNGKHMRRDIGVMRSL